MNVKHYLYGFICGTILSGMTTSLMTSLSGKDRQESIKKGINNIKTPILELKDATLTVSDSIKNVKKKTLTYVPSIMVSVGESVEQYSFSIKENQENLQHHLEEIENLTSTLK